MKNLLKWILIVGGGLFLIIIIGLILIPFFVDMNKYKTPIEEKISASIGRPFSIKGDLELSLFPWAGLSFSDLYLGNPEGFKEKDFVQIKAFEVRVKLLPLLAKDIQIKRFVLDGAKLSYITLKSGRTNIDGLIPSDTAPQKAQPKTESPASETVELPIKSIDVGEFSFTNGSVLIVDERNNSRKEINDITLQLKNVSLTKPIELNFEAKVDKMPMAAQGKLGPLGSPMGKTDIPLDMSFTALDQVKTTLKGTIRQLADNPQFALSVEAKPFSLKKVLAVLGQKDAVTPSDPNVLEKISFQTQIKGDAKAVSLTDGKLVIDDTNIDFNASAKEFDRPNIAFTAHMDQMDVDRYLPKKTKTDGAGAQPPAPDQKTTVSSEKPDYSALRSLVLDVKLTADAIKANNVRIQKLVVDITGNKGVINLKPMTFDLYDGTVKANAQASFKTDTPDISFSLNAADINSNPLFVALMEKDIIEGALKATMDIKTAGTDPAVVKRHLNGRGELLFKNGAIKGVDLTSMARNVKSAFGMAAADASEARTDFAEFGCPFEIVDGVVTTSGTKLASPLLRVNAAGKADLNTEQLDFRIEPNFVATVAGQGDTADRTGFKVPVLVTGTFTSPKFAPDLGSVVQDTLKEKLKDATGIQNLFKKDSTSGDTQTGTSQSTETPATPENTVEDAAKGLLKNLPFGR